MNTHEKLFIKIAASNIPYIGNIVVETINYIDANDVEMVSRKRFQIISDALMSISGEEFKTNLEPILNTHGYVSYHHKLDLLYFNNGSDKFSACEVYLGAWKNSAFSDFNILSNQDKATVLKMVLHHYSVNAIGRKGSRRLNPEQFNDLIELSLSAIDSIEQQTIRYIDVAAIFVLLGGIYFQIGGYDKAALSYIKAIENSIYEGVNKIPTHNGGTYSLSVAFSHLGISFMNLQLKELAEDSLLTSFNLQEKEGSVGGAALDNTFFLASLYEEKMKISDSIKFYKIFLEKGKGQLEHLRKNDSHYLWVRREHAARYIMDNEIGIDPNCICLCGYSNETYLKCCKE